MRLAAGIDARGRLLDVAEVSSGGGIGHRDGCVEKECEGGFCCRSGMCVFVCVLEMNKTKERGGGRWEDGGGGKWCRKEKEKRRGRDDGCV